MAFRRKGVTLDLTRASAPFHNLSAALHHLSAALPSWPPVMNNVDKLFPVKRPAVKIIVACLGSNVEFTASSMYVCALRHLREKKTPQT